MLQQREQTKCSIADERIISGRPTDLTLYIPDADLLAHALRILKQESYIPVSEEKILFRTLHIPGASVDPSEDSQIGEIWPPDRIDGLRRNIIDRIFKQHIPLIYKVGRCGSVTILDHDDVLSEGSLALYRAVKQFDARKGFQFSTYAYRSILHALVTTAKKRQGEREMLELLALDRRTTRHHDDRQAHDNVQILIDQVHAVLAGHIGGLKEVERFVIERRFLSVSMNGVRTLESIGRMLQLGKERIRQIESEALAKMRSILVAHNSSDMLEGFALFGVRHSNSKVNL